MKAFAQLVQEVGSSSKTNEKLAALVQYFQQASDADKVWTIAIFSGRRPKRFVNTRQLMHWCLELSNIPEWLFEECYHTVGDLAETIALLKPTGVADEANDISTESLSQLISGFIQLQKATDEDKKLFVANHWLQMDFDACFVFNKLITGGFRIGVSQKMMVNALEKVTGIAASTLAHRMSGNWDPATTQFDQLLSEAGSSLDVSKPYPFYLAYQLSDEVHTLGEPHEWQAEWKWDGIRGQMIKRNNELFVWSRGEELMTDKFPEYQQLLELLPNGAAIDGEIVALSTNDNNEQNGNIGPAPFAQLQKRIGRKTVSKKLMQEVPVGFIAYDLLEWNATDIRHEPLQQRRALLETLVMQMNHPILQLSPMVPFEDWPALAHHRQGSREQASEGIMLKRKTSAYQVGRKVGDWWKWKIDPLTIDAVLIYAQKGHGRRSNLYTDYTFAVRDGDKLVTFTKAYSGLTDKEFAAVDAFVKQHSLEKFGPVRTVKPELVFEIAFEGIAASNRHKSGVALRFPRMNRWRQDKKPEDINTLDDLKKLLAVYGLQNKKD
jgi:DNA ligase-1